MSEYTAADLSVLKGLDAVRKRPGMYIGSTSSRGLRHLLWEIADNSVDEALGGFGQNIDIILHKDGSVTVKDDGRGMPVDKEAHTGKAGVVVIFTELHAGGKFNSAAYGAAGGLHGVGAAVVNALSSRVDVEVRRDGKLHTISFKDGTPGHFNTKGGFRASDNPKNAGSAEGTGTSVRFYPDTRIFQPDAVIEYDEVISRARQTAFLVPGLTMNVVDERPTTDEDGNETTEPRNESFCFEGGSADFVEYLSTGEPIHKTINLTGEGTYTETVPVLDPETEALVSTDVERTMTVDVALRWNSTYNTNVQSFVNVVSTPKGGTHVTGFERALTKTINEHLRTMKVLKAAEENVVKDDVLEGLSAVILVRIPEPQFEGQTKEILGTTAASRIVNKVVADGLTDWFAIPKNKNEAKAALEKVRAAALARRSAKANRDRIRKKNAVESSAMPAKLRDCRSHDLDEAELFLIEGDSAGGTAVGARNSHTQAILPLRGKILNVLKATEKSMLDNAECLAIITAMGGGWGKDFNLDNIRYGKLILMADADADGDHIRCLLLSLVWKYMRPLLEAGRVYSAVPPLFQLKILTKNERSVFANTPDEMHEKLKELTKTIPRNKIEVVRLKGLGEQDAEDLALTTMDPETRELRRVPIGDAEEAASILEDLMGSKNAEARREYILEHGGLLDLTEVGDA